ncbi:FAD-dependent oxidoreductase [Embleya sp. AB8]|uniref:NAD(P)/FAD-dependent oxidoreductase n=1 Tax=Embleya sp. AB8 TaxID=3156304 RepID=UPI003C785A15
MTTRHHHRIVIVGGGSAGISVAARLIRAGVRDIAVVDPASRHYYQPLWTLVGGGCAPIEESERPQRSVIPRGVRWIGERAVAVDPMARELTLDGGSIVGYEYLVMCAGIQLDWQRIPGLAETLGRDGVSSNYLAELAPRTWRFIRETKSGSAVFSMPSGAIKCAGAAQKIAYLAADYWRAQGRLRDIDVHLVLPTPTMFGIPEFSGILDGVAARYGINVHFGSEVTRVRADRKYVVIRDNTTGAERELPYDMAHLVPPQSAPDWLKKSTLADPGDPAGYVGIDKHTMQHTRHPNVFALGDVASSPNSKTGAAVRKQAPVVVRNLIAAMNVSPLEARYQGYSSCPLTTARRRVLLAEFDYSMRPAPSIPLIDTVRERTDMWYLKRHGLPFLYWNLMLRGRA